MMTSTSEQCPWCGSVVSRAKFEEVQTKIRGQEQAKLAEAEKQLRAQLQAQHAVEVAKQRQVAEANARAEANKQIATANAERDLLQREVKAAQAREAAALQSARQEADSAVKLKLKELEPQRQKDLADLRDSLEKDRDRSLGKLQADFNRDREKLQEKIQEMERQIQKKTSQDLGDGAELDLYEILRESFPDDRITRVQKGQPGADIHHEVMYKGQCCGKILIDSKNRHGWQNAFVTKLRQDQTEASAEHAILASNVFPAGKKEMRIESDVIVVNPARAKHVISLLRRTMITVHVRGLSMTERATKMARLYRLISSEAYRQRFDELGKLTNDVLDLDVQEKKSHDNVWRKRGALATRMSNALREIETDVAAVVEGEEQKELPVAS